MTFELIAYFNIITEILLSVFKIVGNLLLMANNLGNVVFIVLFYNF